MKQQKNKIKKEPVKPDNNKVYASEIKYTYLKAFACKP